MSRARWTWNEVESAFMDCLQCPRNSSRRSNAYPKSQWFSTGSDFAAQRKHWHRGHWHREHLGNTKTSGDIFVITGEGMVLLVSNRWRPGMPLNILQHTGQDNSHDKEWFQPQMPTVSRLRNSVLSHFTDKESSKVTGNAETLPRWSKETYVLYTVQTAHRGNKGSIRHYSCS